MNKTNLTLVISLILLAAIVTTPITVTEDGFARNGNGSHTGDLSQAASVSNSCLNPVSDSNTNGNMINNGNCGGTISEQEKLGQASTPTTVKTANPTIEVQRSTTTAQPPITTTRRNCTTCFDPLNAIQKSDFENILRDRSIRVFGSSITTINQLCTFLRIANNPPRESSNMQNMLLDVEGGQ